MFNSKQKIIYICTIINYDINKCNNYSKNLKMENVKIGKISCSGRKQ